MEEKMNLTKENVIMESARLFAIHGYEAVSIKDIATSVDIKPSSLYNHFTSKENILECVLEKFKYNYYIFLETQKNAVGSENSVQAIMDVLFSSLWEVDNAFMYYGMVIIMKEQFHNTMARNLACKLFFEDSLDYVEGYFDMMADRGIAAPTNSRALSLIFTHTVYIGTMLHVQKSVDADFPVEPDSIYQLIYNYMSDTLQKPKAKKAKVQDF